MDKGKTTRMISGGGYCDKNGKRHQWSKIHAPQTKITDDNWMEYGMPDDEDNNVSNESRNMKRTIRLTESELRHMISESVKRVLNEVSGWTLEKDDVTWVNDAESGASDKAWMVRLWTGSGYILPAFGAYASSEEDALEKVVAYLDQEGDDSFFCDDYVKEMKEELAQEGKDEEEIREEIDERFCYVDATMDGGECHYVFWENLDVYPYDEKRFR